MTMTTKWAVNVKVGPHLQPILECMEMLGAALAGHGHVWTFEERDTYERAGHVLKDAMVVRYER